MTEITSFVKLSPKEAVLDSWRVVEHREPLTGVKVFVGVGVFLLVYFIAREAVQLLLLLLAVPTEGHIYELLAIAPVRVALRVLELGVAALWVAYPLLLKPQVEGQLALTNWRLLYVAQGRSLSRTVISVTAVNLADVLGVHSVYSENVFGRTRLQLVIHTRFHDGLVLDTGAAHSRLGRLPLVGDPFSRDSVSRDAVAMLPGLFARIQQRSGTAIDSRGSY